MRAVFTVWLALSAMYVGCSDQRSSKNEAQGRVKVIVDGPGTKSVPDVRVPAGNADARPLDSEPLIETARRHGLPMPPAEARLVLAPMESWSVLGNRSTSRDPGIYSPA